MGTGFIIGGEQTKRGELSYLAALGYRQKTGRIEYNCGGTLINRYSPEKKYRHPYYINTIEIGLLWAKIIYLKRHAKALAFNFQTGMK